jgi:RP/EB family microtubule-associated protein
MGIRQELLHWLNSLLQLNVTKVEQCGTGYVLSSQAGPTFLRLRVDIVQ